MPAFLHSRLRFGGYLRRARAQRRPHPAAAWARLRCPPGTVRRPLADTGRSPTAFRGGNLASALPAACRVGSGPVG